ncbi:MAG: hypothetical protein IJ557_03565 [Bacteroidaceae bacterium]|nr:hypothetical protein [Bacteroidaceae bacterium]MBR1378189.1 hypothetical protein [Bacteroidaceae bacterium]
MKQKKKTPMLLLPCAVIVAMIGITAYFACSADDDWEGSPEYLHTHAPMLTRAGVDVVGDGIGATLFISNDSQMSDSQYIDGTTGPLLAMNFTWTEGIAGAIYVSAQGVFMDYDGNIYRNLTTTVTSAYCPAAGQYPDSTLVLHAFVNVTGSKYINYVNGHYDRIEPISIIGMEFCTNITKYTHWQLPSIIDNIDENETQWATQDDINNNQNDNEDE